ncbi:MAG: hypothetical protein ABIQ93_06155 [Saprospiraceae bacterium]
MHGFLAHADHHARPVCMVKRDHAAQHIHDARYAADGCTLCAFVLSLSALPSVMVLSESPACNPAGQVPTGYQTPLTRPTSGPAPSRGPPNC